MITRREILTELARLGLRDLREIKQGCREYEDYMAAYYGLRIVNGMRRKTSSLRFQTSSTARDRKDPLSTVKAIFNA